MAGRWLQAGPVWFSACLMSGLVSGGRAQPRERIVHVVPGGFVGGEALAQVVHQLRQLTVVQALAKGWHIAQIACPRRGNAIQQHADQVVRLVAVQIGIERERRLDAELPDALVALVADRAGILVQARGGSAKRARGVGAALLELLGCSPRRTGPRPARRSSR